MKFDPKIHHRRSIRLPGYDYSQAGAYYVTIVVHGRECIILGEIVSGEMRLNQFGGIVRDEWEKSAQIRAEIELGAYIVMPNHFHAIVIIHNRRGDRPVAPTRNASPNGPRPQSIGALMAGFKSSVTKRINEIRKTPGIPIWQRNYYEHIIRNDEEHNRIHLYIEANPANWLDDNENPGKGDRQVAPTQPETKP
jgi:REP element-mobilizing transposase RayT